LPAFVVASDVELRFTVIQGSGLQKLGLGDEAVARLIGTSAEAFFRGPQGEPILQRARAALGGVSESFEMQWYDRWYYAHIAPLRSDAGAVIGVVAVGMDITPRERLRAQLEQERKLLEDAQELAEVGSWVLDIRSGEVHISRQMARLLGINAGARALHWSDLVNALPPNEMRIIEGERDRALRTCGAYDFDHDIVRPDGTIRHVRSRGHVECDESGRPIRFVGTMHDVTERVQAQRAAELLAYHDALTGLPNRWLLRDRLETAIASARRETQNVFVLFIDLDDFKRINDTLGHAMGDVLLAEVGQRLHGIARSSDTVARMGGDEFVIVLTHVDTEEQLQAAVNKLRNAFRAPFRLAGTDYPITASVGIAGFPDDGLTEDELLKHADAAMYDAKQHGRNAVRRFSTVSMASSMRRVQLELDLRRALREHEFRVYYQPIVNARTLRTVGVEALLRWQHPSRGLLLPVAFVDVIEHTSYANAVGEWVLREACAQVAQWRRRLGLPLRLSVNVSARQLQRDHFAVVLKETLQNSGLQPDAVDIELTENTVVRDLESAATVLARLRDIGVGVAIDDFGTGYNSLSYLKYFPITALKIDRSFVGEIGVDAFDEAISSAVAALGRALRIRVVAEGVEQRSQLESLLALGCDEVQGYYFAPPMEAQQLDSRLAQEAAAG
jgi:diguanylate cyclase (GGDEF)-like protein/PAS domain S-box-containing protein